MKKSVKTVVRKVKHKAKHLLFFWHLVAALIIFFILSPIFIHAHETKSFYTIVFSLSAIILGLTVIVRRAMKKWLREYVTKSSYYIGAGTIILLVELLAPIPWLLHETLLVTSAASYSIGLARLGFRYFLGIV